MLKQHQTDSVLQRKVAASWNSICEGRCQVYGNIDHTESGIQSTFSRFLLQLLG